MAPRKDKETKRNPFDFTEEPVAPLSRDDIDELAQAVGKAVKSTPAQDAVAARVERTRERTEQVMEHARALSHAMGSERDLQHFQAEVIAAARAAKSELDWEQRAMDFFAIILKNARTYNSRHEWRFPSLRGSSRSARASRNPFDFTED